MTPSPTLTRRWRGLICVIALAALGAGCSSTIDRGFSPVPTRTLPVRSSPTAASTPTLLAPSPVSAAAPTATAAATGTNPAISFCHQRGGRFEALAPASGGLVGVCRFADGTVCEQAAFYQGECQPGQSADLPPVSTTSSEAYAPLVALFTTIRTRVPANAFDYLAAQPLETDDDRQLWMVYSFGARNTDHEPLLPHFLAIYSYTQGYWQERAQTALGQSLPQENVNLEPDSVGTVRQVIIAPGRIWIQIEGSVGAHGGSYHLFSFDGQRLRAEVIASSPSPGVGRIEDLNGDGINDVVLDRSDPYVFCYACGVYRPFYEAYTWQAPAQRLIRLAIADLTDEYQTASFAELNRQAVALAEASLWDEAARAIDQAVAQAGDADPPTTAGSLRWNQRLIALNRAGHLEAIKTSAYPLISYIFYGDYTSAVNQMRPYAPADIFSVRSPLIVGTVAEDWIPQLGEIIQQYTERALAVAPNRADIAFVQAWGQFLVDPRDPAIGADLERAHRLQPHDPLFAAAAQAWGAR